MPYHRLIPNHSFPNQNLHPWNTPPSRGMDQPTDLLSLVPPQENQKKKKAPSKRNHNHLGAPSTAGSHPGGKKMSANGTISGDTDSDSDANDSSNTQEDEDADDETDEDEEEPAVDSLARVNRKRKHTFSDSDQKRGAVFKRPTTSRKTKSTVHSAGRTYKKRTYSMESTDTAQSSTVSEFDGGIITETEDEPDYPRKKAARHLATCDDSLKPQSHESVSEDPDSETIIEDLDADYNASDSAEGNEDDGGANIDNSSPSVADTPVLSEDDEEIDKIEAQELAREFELEGPDYLVDVASSLDLPLESDELLPNDECIRRPGLPSSIDPLQWDDLSTLLYYDHMANDNLFPVPASREPSPTPHPVRVNSPLMAFHSDEWSDDEDNEEIGFWEQAEQDNFEIPGRGAWKLTESEDENIWQAFEETGESSEEESDLTDAVKESGEGTEVEEDYDSDATDLDDNLPAPTPQKDSKLKRSSSQTSKPQILRRDPANKQGPLLGSWIADPDRPICIIDGTKKTLLIPAGPKRFSLGSDPSPHRDLFTFDESDYYWPRRDDHWLYRNYNTRTDSPQSNNHTVSEMVCGSLYDASIQDFESLLQREYAANDSVSEEERMISIEDVLDISESEDEGGNEDQTDVNLTPIARKTMAGDNSDVERTLNRWDSVSVTAFRKRQQQHQQRLSGQAEMKSRSALNGKLTVIDTTMTPSRRRRSRTASRGPVSINNSRITRSDDTQWSTPLPPVFETV